MVLLQLQRNVFNSDINLLYYLLAALFQPCYSQIQADHYYENLYVLKFYNCMHLYVILIFVHFYTKSWPGDDRNAVET
jgi:hypothetical protein